jgi:hypothetical protein
MDDNILSEIIDKINDNNKNDDKVNDEINNKVNDEINNKVNDNDNNKILSDAKVDVEIEPDVKSNYVKIQICSLSIVLNCFNSQ